MATMVLGAPQWHAGEEEIQRRLGHPIETNPTSLFLPSAASYFLTSCPVIALGTVSRESGAPWVSLIGGNPGFAVGVGDSLVAFKSNVGREDPILDNMKAWDGIEEEEGIRHGEGMVAGLAIDMDRRRRLKFFGRAMRESRTIEELDDGNTGERSIGMVLKVSQSLGNCPKYITRRKVHHISPTPVLHSSPLPLPQTALDLISRIDIFFVASRNQFSDMDVNIRGGPPGFLRILHNDRTHGTVIVWPEYSGNRLYQTLGNFQVIPLAGVTIPDFSTGDILYLSGTVVILFEKEADDMIPRTNLAVKMTVTSARFVLGGLGIRGAVGEFSPYNPPVRYLAIERPDPVALAKSSTGPSALRARLKAVKKLTPKLARFTFQLLRRADGDCSEFWTAGQFVALSFADELSAGYRHMDDLDPSGLNDDYARTFTVSSPPPRALVQKGRKSVEEFEITVQKVGVVTEFLFSLTPRDFLEVPVLGFGGDFCIDKNQLSEKKATFVAGGVGLTPFLAQFPEFTTSEVAKVELLWSIRAADVSFAQSVLSPTAMKGLANVTSLFITGGDPATLSFQLNILKRWGLKNVYLRRMQPSDLVETENAGDSTARSCQRTPHTWYLCANGAFRKQLLNWLDGEEVVWEDFGY